MKHIIPAVALMLTASLSFAAPTVVECTSDTLFTNNSCQTCYSESYDTIKTDTGWSLELNKMVVPWKHIKEELSENIIKNEQTPPEMIVPTGATMTPQTTKEIWDFHTDITWLSTGENMDEFVLEKDENISLYQIKPNTSWTLAGKDAVGPFLLKSEKTYYDLGEESFELGEAKKHMTCIMGVIKTPAEAVAKPPVKPEEKSTEKPADTSAEKKTDTVDTQTASDETKTATEDNKTETDTQKDGKTETALNAAGPEITSEQTEPEAGPEMWIFLALAFVCASAWNAWRKSQNV